MIIKILVVEDTRDVRFTLCGILTDNGYTAHPAANEGEAVVAIRREHFDFALIDVRLHEGGEDDQSGLSLAMALHDMDREIQIILLSRYDNKSQFIQAVKYHGVVGFIDKSNTDWMSYVLTRISEVQNSTFPDRSRYIQTPATHFMYSLVPEHLIGSYAS